MAGTYTISNATTSAWSIADTSAATNTYNFGGKTLGNVTVNNGTTTTAQLVTSGFLQGATATFTHTQGGLDFNSINCTIGLFSSANTNTRSITGGTATITLLGAAATLWNVNPTTGLTLSMASSTITMSGTAATFTHLGNATYGTIKFTGSSNGNKLNFGNGNTGTMTSLVRTGTATGFDGLTILSNLNITGGAGSLNLSGNSTVNRIRVGAFDNANGPTTTPITITCSAAPTLSNVNFHDITAAGAGGTWSGTAVGDMGGNSNITFATPVTRYRVGAGGNYSDTTKWSATDNGTTGVTAPLPQDTVFIDANASGTITMDMAVFGKDVDFTGFAGILSNSVGLEFVCGNWTNGSGMTHSGSQNLFLFGRGSQTFTSNGVQFANPINLLSNGGTYTLVGALSTAGGLNIQAGTWDALTNSPNMTANFFNVMAAIGGLTRTVSLGNGNSLTLNRATANVLYTLNSVGLTMNPGTCNIIIGTTSTNLRQIDTGGVTNPFYDLTYTIAGSTGGLQMFLSAQSATIHSIKASDVTNARSVIFFSGSTTTFTGTIPITGTSGKLTTITTTTGGSAANWVKSNGDYLSWDFSSIKDISASGGATFFAGANSSSVSGNSGIVFTAPTWTANMGMLLGVGTGAPN